MLEVRNLSLQLGKKSILNNVNFTLENNEILCILGKNGSGKSSLLKCILSIWEHYSGGIFLENDNVAHLSHRIRAKKFAYMPQNCNITFPFTLLEVVMMGRFANAQLSYNKADEAIALQSLETLGLIAHKDIKFHNLSGGQKQLGLFARALTQESRIMILDEPISALDLGACARLLEIIKSLKKSIIITSHRPEQCFIAHKALLMKGGEILAFGKADEVLNTHNIDALYGVESDFISLPDKSKYFYVKQ